MAFTPEQRQAIRTLDMGNVITSLFLKEHRPVSVANSIKPKGFVTWAIITPNGTFELTEVERMAVLATLKKLDEVKNAGPQIRYQADPKL